MHKIIERENGQVHIIGNGHYRDIVYGHELTDTEKSEHDYLDYDEDETHEFVRYLGYTYYLGDCMAIHNNFYNPNPPSWMLPFDGYFSEGFCGGVLVSYGTEDELGVEFGTKIKIYRYY